MATGGCESNQLVFLRGYVFRFVNWSLPLENRMEIGGGGIFPAAESGAAEAEGR